MPLSFGVKYLYFISKLTPITSKLTPIMIAFLNGRSQRGHSSFRMRAVGQKLFSALYLLPFHPHKPNTTIHFLSFQPDVLSI